MKLTSIMPIFKDFKLLVLVKLYKKQCIYKACKDILVCLISAIHECLLFFSSIAIV